MLLRGLYAALLAKPRHDLGVGSQAALQDFVPADNLAALGIDIFLHALDEPALELVLVFETEFLYHGLAVRALLPAGLGALVAAYVYELRGEQVDDLVEHIFKELESLFLGAIYLLEDAPPGGGLIVVFQAAAELGIARNGRQRMARNLYFGDDGYVTVGGILDEGLDFFLSIVASVRLAVIYSRSERPHYGLLAPLPLLCKQGIFLDLDAPALVFSKVPVETVHLMQGHEVDVALEERNVEEVQAAVQMHAPVGETGSVFDVAARQRPAYPVLHRIGKNSIRKQLEKGLQGIESTCSGSEFNHYPIRIDIQIVSLLGETGVKPEQALFVAVPQRVVGYDI